MTGALDSVDADVRMFFAEFERAGNTDDVALTESQFANVFLNADPNGTSAIPRTHLIDKLPQRRQFFASIGLQRTTLTAISQTTLDTHYVLAKTDWSAELENGDPLALSSTFMLRRENASLRIVLYLNHLDIVASVRERLNANSIK
jgi:hypothetical protein